MLKLFRQLITALSLLLVISNTFCLSLFNHDNESSGIHGLLHHNSENQTLLHRNSSETKINPEAKTAAKVVACESIGKGICLGVATVKYTEKKLTESTPAESGSKSNLQQ